MTLRDEEGMTHLVSLVIPTHNRSAALKEALESALAVQRSGFELEIIVVDDGSTDSTAQVAQGYPVRYVREEGLGAAAARNSGIAAARGEFITFLDDDDLLLANAISPQLELLVKHPEYGAVYAQSRLAGSDGQPYGLPLPAAPMPDGWIHERLLHYWPQIGTLVVRTAVVKELGGLNPALRSEEEWDWLLRIAQRHQIGAVAQPVMLFRQRGHGDDAMHWRRFPDTMRVFKEHARQEGVAARLRLLRTYWGHRGWYTDIFLTHAREYRRRGDTAQALRCIGYAVRISPMHVVHSLFLAVAASGSPIVHAALQARQQSRVVVIANYSGYITGDDAIFESLSALTYRVFGPSTKIYVLTGMPKRTGIRYPAITTIGHIYRFLESTVGRRRVSAALAQADMLIIGGGDIVEGQRALLALAVAARLAGTPVTFAGVGILQPRSTRQELQLRLTLAMAHLVAVRDLSSAQLARVVGVREPRLRILPDLAVALPQGDPAQQRSSHRIATKRPFAAVNLRAPDLAQYRTAWGEVEYEAVASICRWLIDEQGIDIVGVPLVTAASGPPAGDDDQPDDQLLLDLARRIDRPGHVQVFLEDLSPKEVAVILGQARCAIGMRLHFLILSANGGVPIVALSYARKVQAFMEGIGLLDYCLEVSGLEQEVLRSVVHTALTQHDAIAAHLESWHASAVQDIRTLEPLLEAVAQKKSRRRLVRRLFGWTLSAVFLRRIRW